MILPDKEFFTYKECEIAGDKCWLITPNHIGVKWVNDNARFRSCIVRQSDNFVVSQGFAKFVNFHEQPDFQPWDDSWPIEARHKMDGSLLIVSKYKGELIIRTRGTVDARQMPNGHEIDLLIKKYPDVFIHNRLDTGWTWLFEWTTPSNIIVLREHDEPTLTLVGCVKNDNCYYESQSTLDLLQVIIGVDRPQKYTYNSIAECLADVEGWKGKEGVVLYSPDGQTLKKIKAREYYSLHCLATGLTSFEHVVDVFLASPRYGTKQEFFDYVEKTLSWEIAIKLEHHIERVVECYVHFTKRVSDMVSQFMIKDIFNYPTRKEQAQDVLRITKNSWEKTMGFLILDSAEPDDKLLKKILLTINDTLDV